MRAPRRPAWRRSRPRCCASSRPAITWSRRARCSARAAGSFETPVAAVRRRVDAGRRHATSAPGKRRSGPTPRLFFLESPTNPTLEVIDIAAVAELAHAAGAQVVVDNVFATPILQKPLELGAACRRLFGDQAHRRPGPLPRRRRPVGQGVDRQEPARLFPPHRPGLSPVQRLGDAEGSGNAAAARHASRRKVPARIADFLAEHADIEPGASIPAVPTIRRPTSSKSR